MAAPTAADLVEPVRLRLQGLDPNLVTPVWCETVGDFLRRSSCAREWIGPYHVYAGQTDVPLDPVPSGTVRTPLRVEVSGKPLDGDAWTCPEPAVVRLSWTPDKFISQGFDAWCSLAPSGNSGAPLPLWLHQRWFDTILDGVLSRLLLMGGKPWSNAQIGAYHAGRYDNGVKRARTDAEATYRRENHSYVRTRTGWA